MENGTIRGWYKVCEWITRFAFLNTIWIMLTLLGLGVFGFFPATVSMLVIVRKWLHKEEVDLIKTFWENYKLCFVRSNILGSILIGIWFVFYYDMVYFFKFNILITNILSLLLLLLLAILSLMIVYVFPLYAHYNLTVKDYLKNAFILVVMFPFSSFFLFLIIIGSLSLIRLYPGYIFFSGSIMSYLIMYHSLRLFSKLQLKHRKIIKVN